MKKIESKSKFSKGSTKDNLKQKKSVTIILIKRTTQIIDHKSISHKNSIQTSPTDIKSR